MESRIPSKHKPGESVHESFVTEVNLQESDSWFDEHIENNRPGVSANVTFLDPVICLESSVAVAAQEIPRKARIGYVE